jgi:hypothetical protein
LSSVFGGGGGSAAATILCVVLFWDECKILGKNKLLLCII